MLLDTLHAEHEEAASLLDRITEAEEGKERTELFNELKEKLSLHLRAESKVLYAKLQKDDEARGTALEGDVEHELVLAQLDELSRMRNKAGDEWLARAKVVKELVHHHVEEEEGELWEEARRVFDEDAFEKLDAEFAREKERLAGSGRGKARSAAAPRESYAGDKPRAGRRAAAKRAPARRKRS